MRHGLVIQRGGDLYAVRHRCVGAGRVNPEIPRVLPRRVLNPHAERQLGGRFQGGQRRRDLSHRSQPALQQITFRPLARCDFAFRGIQQRPPDRGVLQVVRPELADLHLCSERFPLQPDPLGHARQRNDRAAVLPVLFRRDVALGVPECIEHTDRRRPATGEILEAQKLEPAQPGRPQKRLNLLFVEQRLGLARRHQEIARLREQSFLLQEVADDLEVPRLQQARVLRHLSKIREDTPLPRLMAEVRHVVSSHAVPVIDCGLWRIGVEPFPRAELAVHPEFPEWDVVVGSLDGWPSRSPCVQPSRVLLPVVLYPGLQKHRAASRPGGLVTVGHQHE